MNPPGRSVSANKTIDEVKHRIQTGLRVNRDRQLEEPSVRQFVARMNRPFKRDQGFFCINDVIDDGNDLADKFEAIRSMPDENRDKALGRLFKPEVEFCGGNAKCSSTGLKLIDIWRYFRHTWSLEYRSIPGRHMPILIRNAARPNRPVIGIALLASPVIRLGRRDEWVGWTLDTIIKKYSTGKLDPIWFCETVLVQ